MTKYIKFMLTPTGDLMYRNTGQYYNKKFTVRGNTVYGANGRKIGNIGKPTKAQEKRMETARLNREKKLRQQVRKLGGKPKNGNLSYKDLADAGEMAVWNDVPLSRYQQELINFSTIIDECVQSGKMTPEEGQSYVNRWMGAKNDSERNAIWNDIKKNFKDRGYQYD